MFSIFRPASKCKENHQKPKLELQISKFSMQFRENNKNLHSKKNHNSKRQYGDSNEQIGAKDEEKRLKLKLG